MSGDLVTVLKAPVLLGVLLVHGVEQTPRFLAQAERRPDVAHGRRAVELALAPARALAQTRRPRQSAYTPMR